MLNDLRNIIAAKAYRLGIDQEIVNSLSDIFFSAFGEAFFNNLPESINRITGQKEIAHPLIKNIVAKNFPPEMGISELLEVGLYLKSFSTDPKISYCINNLRDVSQYESTLFQLAMAHRLKLAGCQVGLEPETIRGKADISFEYTGVKYIGECYRINKKFSDYYREFEGGFYDVLFRLVPRGKKYAFTIKLNYLLTPDGMRSILQRYKNILNDFNSQQYLTHIEFNHKNNLVGVEDITHLELDPDFKLDEKGNVKRIRYLDADSCVCAVPVKGTSIFRFMDTPLAKREHASRVILWKNYKKPSTKSAYNILEQKINQKLKQTKVEDISTRRVLFVEFPFGLFWGGKITDAQRKIQNDALRRFQNIAGIVLTERTLNNKNRFFYQGVILLGNLQYSIPESLCNSFNRVELDDLFKL